MVQTQHTQRRACCYTMMVLLLLLLLLLCLDRHAADTHLALFSTASSPACAIALLPASIKTSSSLCHAVLCATPLLTTAAAAARLQPAANYSCVPCKRASDGIIICCYRSTCNLFGVSAGAAIRQIQPRKAANSFLRFTFTKYS
jgi:hypothetical protein